MEKRKMTGRRDSRDKKQIAIVTQSMGMGGVEKALIQMLRHLDYSRCSVDLYLVRKEGELLREIPKNVQVLQLPTVKPRTSWRHPVTAMTKALFLSKMKRQKLPFIEQCRLSCKMYLPVRKFYDTAISYHAPNTVPVFYVIDKMNAGRKVLWLHGDLDTNDGYTKTAGYYHARYDKIIGVAESVIRSFLTYHPDQKDRTEVIYNFMDVDEIRKKSRTGETYSDSFEGIRILTIGRLTRQKGYDLAVRACERLIRENYPLRWYALGEGEERPALERMIQEKDLGEFFILLGKKNNPYRYLRECDFYVQTSRTEGFCTTTNEARVLGKTVITTDVSGAREQFTDGKTGWIVPVSEKAIYARLKWCLDHREAAALREGTDSPCFSRESSIAWLYEP